MPFLRQLLIKRLNVCLIALCVAGLAISVAAQDRLEPGAPRSLKLPPLPASAPPAAEPKQYYRPASPVGKMSDWLIPTEIRPEPQVTTFPDPAPEPIATSK